MEGLIYQVINNGVEINYTPNKEFDFLDFKWTTTHNTSYDFLVDIKFSRIFKRQMRFMAGTETRMDIFIVGYDKKGRKSLKAYKNGKKKGKPIYGNDYLQFSEDRATIRSKTFVGIAKAMADQWP